MVGRMPVNDSLGQDKSATYEIQVQGRLDASWSHWFEGMTIAFRDGITTLTGAVSDQAALRGILSKIWDLNLAVVSVNRIEKNLK